MANASTLAASLAPNQWYAPGTWAGQTSMPTAPPGGPGYSGPTGADGPIKPPGSVPTGPPDGGMHPNTAATGGGQTPRYPAGNGPDPSNPYGWPDAYSGGDWSSNDVPNAGSGNPGSTPPPAAPPASTNPTPTTPPAGTANPLTLGGGWDQFAKESGTQQYWLQEAFKQGISGEAAVQFANSHGAPGIAYYSDRNMYGLPNGYYVAPSETGAMDLIQRVSEGTPGRQYGGMKGLYPYKTATPANLADPTNPPTPDPANAPDPNTQGYTSARSTLDKLIASLTGNA